MNIISLFSGAGGFDLGFEKAGFNILYANEYDKDIWNTYEYNFKNTHLDRRSITEINEKELPECDGIIGGPPCQSWSAAGSLRGIKDKRGQLFYDFIRVLREKQPKFFVAENVSGMLSKRHENALVEIKKTFKDSGYKLYFKMLNAYNYGVAQDRKRIFFIGIRLDCDNLFSFPDEIEKKIHLSDVIYDLKDTAMPCMDKGKANKTDDLTLINHEYLVGSFSTMYMSRNRVRGWGEASFTIQAGGRHAPIHPSAPKMIKVEKDVMIFQPKDEKLYRRLSVRECARIQGFPDDFKFLYRNVLAGYKMIGNAVPVNLAYILGLEIKQAFLNQDRSVFPQ